MTTSRLHLVRKKCVRSLPRLTVIAVVQPNPVNRSYGPRSHLRREFSLAHALGGLPCGGLWLPLHSSRLRAYFVLERSWVSKALALATLFLIGAFSSQIRG